MSGEQPADEVAEDYKASLEYLTNNDKFAINNFTVIAKENTEHADAISNVLVEHIGKARPDHKLPALYVLDSVAKNIGTPYTLFLGHRLYSTFMDAYSKVDKPTRKKLDEMLKTWKSPVPGSIDSRPVFPIEITKKIENALIQVKTRAIQFEQEQQRSQQELLQRRGPSGTPVTQWRNTPTPPQNGPFYPPHPNQAYAHSQNNGTPQNMNLTPSQFDSYTQPQVTLPYQLPAAQPNSFLAQQAMIPNLDTLHRDLEDLIRVTKENFARNISDWSLHNRLKALLDLQNVLRNQQLPPEQIQAIRRQVSDLQEAQKQNAQPALPVLNPQPNPNVAPTPPQPLFNPSTSQSPFQVQAAAPPSLPPANVLASLLASVERSRSTPAAGGYPLPPSLQTPQPSAPGLPSILPPATNGSSLIESLRASGLLSTTGSAPKGEFQSQISVTSRANAPQQSLNLSDLLRGTLKPPANRDKIELTPASLKIPRPQLISKLYDSKPNQCLTCGRRFTATDEGREQKARHLDWHFRTNQRIAESAQRGRSRSWYVGELEWINFRGNEENGVDDSKETGNDTEAFSAEAANKNDPKKKFIPVPNDSNLANMPCPICQEKFEQSWNEEKEDFVWMDAIRIGNRIYHASCYADFKKDGGNTPGRTSTPESVLGKRKAEGQSNNPSPAKSSRQNKAAN